MIFNFLFNDIQLLDEFMPRYFLKLKPLTFLILAGILNPILVQAQPLSQSPPQSLPQPLVQSLAQPSAQLFAQSNGQFSDDQIRRYAEAAAVIEKKRDEVWRRAKGYEGWNSLTSRAEAQGVTVCGLKKSEQPPIIQGLCSELFEFSEQEIRRRGFSSNREFNQITQAQKQNGQLQKRIQFEILEFINPKK